MNVFWREQPLSIEEAELYQLVLEAHGRSAFRGNVSGQAVAMAAVGSGNYFQSIAAGLMTLGGLHGPVEQTMEFLDGPNITRRSMEMIDFGAKIPGWGNSFIKGHKDDLWLNVDEALGRNFPKAAIGLSQVTEVLHAAGKDLYPNPSAYTAATALLLGLPAPIAAFLLVAGRLVAWTQLAAQNLKGK